MGLTFSKQASQRPVQRGEVFPPPEMQLGPTFKGNPSQEAIARSSELYEAISSELMRGPSNTSGPRLKVLSTLMEHIKEILPEHINQSRPSRNPLIVLAARFGSISTFKALLAHPNIDIRAAGPNGNTAWLEATASGNVEIINLILGYKPQATENPVPPAYALDAEVSVPPPDPESKSEERKGIKKK